MDMSQPQSEYSRLDEAALATGLGLILFGLVVLGVFETLAGSPHIAEHVPGAGVIVVHTSFTPTLRAAVIASGFLVLLGWALARVGRAILASHGADS